MFTLLREERDRSAEVMLKSHGYLQASEQHWKFLWYSADNVVEVFPQSNLQLSSILSAVSNSTFTSSDGRS